MRRRLFHVTTLVSLVLLAMVLVGLFSSVALTRYSTDPSATPPLHRQTSLKLYRGQVEIFLYDIPLQSGAMPALGVRYKWLWDGYWMPGSKAIAGFDSRPAVLLPGFPGSTHRYFAFPLWLLGLPFVIAPLQWLREWRGKRRAARMDGSGAFPVGFEQ